MAMTLTAAKSYVAKIIAGQNDANLLAAAGDAINATYAKWEGIKDWTFLLKDTSETTSVASCVVAVDGLTVTNATVGALNAVNKGQTVTGYAGGSGTITIASITEGSTGVTAFTLSSAVTPGTYTLTFSADIVVTANQQRYNLPLDFSKPYLAYLSVLKVTLEYIKKRELYRKVTDPALAGYTSFYTTFRPHSFNSSSQHTHMDLFRVPSAADLLRLLYYRGFNTTDTNIDIPDTYLYVFLDDARVHLVKQKADNDPRLPVLIADVETGIARCIADDEVETEDEDLRLQSQMEMGFGMDRPIYYDRDWR